MRASFISNALKYGSAPVTAEAERDDRSTTIAVCAHGEGVPGDQRPGLPAQRSKACRDAVASLRTLSRSHPSASEDDIDGLSVLYPLGEQRLCDLVSHTDEGDAFGIYLLPRTTGTVIRIGDEVTSRA